MLDKTDSLQEDEGEEGEGEVLKVIKVQERMNSGGKSKSLQCLIKT